MNISIRNKGNLKDLKFDMIASDQTVDIILSYKLVEG
jgi:hypothetical protein